MEGIGWQKREFSLVRVGMCEVVLAVPRLQCRLLVARWAGKDFSPLDIKDFFFFFGLPQKHWALDVVRIVDFDWNAPLLLLAHTYRVSWLEDIASLLRIRPIVTSGIRKKFHLLIRLAWTMGFLALLYSRYNNDIAVILTEILTLAVILTMPLPQAKQADKLMHFWVLCLVVTWEGCLCSFVWNSHKRPLYRMI